MILITGATGTIGRELVQNLLAHRLEFKVMVRSEQTRAAMTVKGIEAVLGDFTRPETFAPALEGVRQAFLLTTPQPDIVQVEGGFLEAARKAGVKRMVRLSAMGADPWGSSPLARCHGLCESQLEASGMAWTILRPTMFMQNLAPMYGESVAKTSTLYAPAGDARIPWVDARDIAAVARIVLTDAGHQGLVYEITGPELHTYEGVAAILSRQLGRTVKFVDVPDDAAYSSMTSMGMSGWMAHSLVTLFHLFRANGGTAVTLGTVARVTGRPPRTLEAYLTENIAAFRGAKAGANVHSEDQARSIMENRHYPRVAVESQCKARFQLGGRTYDEITVSNLGEDGCCLSGPTRSLGALNDKATLDNWQLIHPALPRNAIKAKVVWVHRQKQGTDGITHTGIEFQNAPVGFTRSVGKYVTTLSH